ncbi:hypothetical protein BDV95DRAFT_597944 [Massariosphaeria phaeospora]|uniref:Uncharacterized protein n=1 Tax=Massariosphaeria phaeospora TaxID=100035 RepID=A0A7C8M4Q6_9PLEO|nr:hypothetical protein BDV95DRAFT_597944 [Massariosphaeria phaeospora]
MAVTLKRSRPPDLRSTNTYTPMGILTMHSTQTSRDSDSEHNGYKGFQSVHYKHREVVPPAWNDLGHKMKLFSIGFPKKAWPYGTAFSITYGIRELVGRSMTTRPSAFDPHALDILKRSAFVSRDTLHTAHTVLTTSPRGLPAYGIDDRPAQLPTGAMDDCSPSPPYSGLLYPTNIAHFGRWNPRKHASEHPMSAVFANHCMLKDVVRTTLTPTLDSIPNLNSCPTAPAVATTDITPGRVNTTIIQTELHDDEGSCEHLPPSSSSQLMSSPQPETNNSRLYHTIYETKEATDHLSSLRSQKASGNKARRQALKKKPPHHHHLVHR